tara:strand:- start:69210 stop:70505 length:1296 start_codon:yes stop_codon:yes gene_type:complete
MDITVNINVLKGLQRSMKIVVSKNNYSTVFKKNLTKMQSQVKMDGFRSGKIPEKVILSKYKQDIHNNSVNELIQEALSKAIVDNQIQTVSSPQLTIDTHPSDNSDLAFTAKFEIFPEFSLNNIAEIIVEKPDVKIENQDIEDVINNIRKQHTKWKTKTSSAESGDKVVIDYEGLIDNKSFENSKQTDFTFIINSDVRGDEATKGLFAEFYKSVIGENIGTNKNFSYQMPKNFPDKNLSNKKVDYKIHIKNIYSGVLPKLNNEFYKNFGLEGVSDKEFKENILKHISKELDDKIKSNQIAIINQELIDKNNFDIPTSMIESQKEDIYNQYKAMMKETDESLTNEINIVAEKRAKLNILYIKLAKEFNITITDSDVSNYIASNYPSDQKDKIAKNTNLINEIKNKLLESAIIENILSKCKIKVVKKIFKEVMN